MNHLGLTWRVNRTWLKMASWKW